MSEDFDASSLLSKKGWFDADYDAQVWIPCPAVFPEGVDREIYAAGVAGIWFERVPPDRRRPGDVELLAAQLSEIHQATYGKVAVCYVFVHLPDPVGHLPLVVNVGVWEARGDAGEQLRMLCLADDPDAVEPPIVDEFATPRLGTGLRVLRYCRLTDDDGALYSGLNYAFRSAELETDLALSVVSEDLGRLQGAMPDIEALVRSMSIISQDELT